MSDEPIGSCACCGVPLYRESSQWVRDGKDVLRCFPCWELVEPNPPKAEQPNSGRSRLEGAVRDPKSAEEWQRAVDGASFLLRLHSVEPDDRIAAARCRELLERGPAIGFEPCSVEEFLEREFGRAAG